MDDRENKPKALPWGFWQKVLLGEAEERNFFAVLLWLVAASSLMFVFVKILGVWVQKGMVYAYPMQPEAFDFAAYWEGFRALKNNMNPYEAVPMLVTPPPSLYLIGGLFSWTTYEVARNLIFGLFLILIVLSCYWVARSRFNESTSVLASFFLSWFIVEGQPFYMLLDRLNAEWLLLPLCACGFCCIFKDGDRVDGASALDLFGGFLLGLAASIKIYPFLLIFPLAVSKKRGAAAAMGVTVLLLFLLTNSSELWVHFFDKLRWRSDMLDYKTSHSVFCLFYYIFKGFPWLGNHEDIQQVKFLGLSLFSFFLLINVSIDLLYSRIANFGVKSYHCMDCFVSYIPLMIWVPVTSFFYELIFLTLLIPFLSRELKFRSSMQIISCGYIALGLLMTQFQSTSMDLFLQVVSPKWQNIPYVMQLLGVLIINISFLVYKSNALFVEILKKKNKRIILGGDGATP